MQLQCDNCKRTIDTTWKDSATLLNLNDPSLITCGHCNHTNFRSFFLPKPRNPFKELFMETQTKFIPLDLAADGPIHDNIQSGDRVTVASANHDEDIYIFRQFVTPDDPTTDPIQMQFTSTRPNTPPNNTLTISIELFNLLEITGWDRPITEPYTTQCEAHMLQPGDQIIEAVHKSTWGMAPSYRVLRAP